MAGYLGASPVPQTIQKKQSFTATASQTTFTTTGYTDGAFINVYLNGVRLINGTDYTATNGSDIVLTSAASASDVLDFETFNEFTLVDQTLETPTFRTSATLKNDTEEDTDGGRESTLIFKGEQSGGEISTLAEIEASHDGTADDQKGDLIFKTNDGSDNDAPTERLRIDSAGSIIPATLGTDNVHLGEGAGASIASGGNDNVVIGKNAGTALTTGDSNVAIGHEALAAQTTAGTNTVVGNNAGASNTSGAITAFGSNALTANTTGNYSHAFGESALLSNTTGQSNIAVGGSSLRSNTTGSSNVAVGDSALRALTTGSHNTGLGHQAGNALTTADHNVCVGRTSGLVLTGSSSTFVGSGSGREITSGAKNTIIGGYGGNQDSVDIRTLSNNIILSDGDGLVQYWHRGSDNTTVLAGAHAGNAWNTDSGMRIHGNGATAQYVTVTNESSTATDEAFVVHRVAAVTNGEAIQFYRAGSAVGSINVSSGSTSYNTSSDYRLKENVSDLTGATEKLKQLQPRVFSWIADDLDAADTEGFIAHEVQDIVPKAVSGSKDEMKVDHDGNTVPRYQGIDHGKLVPLLTAALQEAIAKIETLETKVAALEAE